MSRPADVSNPAFFLLNPRSRRDTCHPPALCSAFVESPLLREDEWPRSRETAELARRLAAVTWFRRDRHARDPSGRLAAALRAHARLARLSRVPSTVSVLDGGGGRKRLGSRGGLRPASWEGALRALFGPMRDAVLRSGRAEKHPLLLPSGRALLIRPQALPLSQDALWSALRGPADDRLPASVVRRLVDRTLWEAGMMLAWELVGDLVGDNPFAPLLVIYEEGLYPLDLAREEALLWNPS